MDWIGERCCNLYDEAIEVRCKKPIDGAHSVISVAVVDQGSSSVNTQRIISVIAAHGAPDREFRDASTFRPNCVASCLKAF
jgi:hypothetical protein